MAPPMNRPTKPAAPDGDKADPEGKADIRSETRPPTRPNPPAGAPPTSTGSRPGSATDFRPPQGARGGSPGPGPVSGAPVPGGPAGAGPAPTPVASPLASLPDNAFALPGRRYPIHNPPHALASMDAIAQRGTPFEQGMVTGMVKARHPGINVYGPRAVIPQQHL